MARSRKTKKSIAYSNLNLFIDGMKHIQKEKIYDAAKSKQFSEFLFISSALMDSFNSNCNKHAIKSFMLDIYPIVIDIINSAKEVKSNKYSTVEKFKTEIKSLNNIEIKRVNRSRHATVYPVCLTIKHKDIPQIIVMSCFLNETLKNGPSYGVFLDILNTYKYINIKDLEFSLIEESLLNPIL
jgi:hypothetical protein